MARSISLLNSQIVVNSGSISNPSNSVAVIKNSERVRNDILNIVEYINGYIYYLTKNLTSGTLYPVDAAEKGLYGDTLVSDLNATSSSGNTFWFATSETAGRPKTIKESLEALESKLLQQQVNISVLERTNLSNLASNLNTNILLTHKIKKNVLGETFNVSSNDLSYPLSQYIHKIYATLFPSNVPTELNVGTALSDLTFDYMVEQTNVKGCGSYTSLQGELDAIKSILNGGPCDPTFTVAFDQGYYSTAPTNIEGFVQELHDYGVILKDNIATNATDISAIETQIQALQGVSLATESVVGISEQATKDEILMGVGANGSNKLFMSPDNFCDTIINQSQASFNNTQVSKLGLAWKKATNYVLNDLGTPRNRNIYYTYTNADISNNHNYIVAFNRTYFLTTATGNGSITINSGSISAYETGSLLTIKKSDSANQMTINVNINNTYLISGSASYTLTQPYECVTFMLNKDKERIEIISRYV